MFRLNRHERLREMYISGSKLLIISIVQSVILGELPGPNSYPYDNKNKHTQSFIFKNHLDWFIALLQNTVP